MANAPTSLKIRSCYHQGRLYLHWWRCIGRICCRCFRSGIAPTATASDHVVDVRTKPYRFRTADTVLAGLEAVTLDLRINVSPAKIPVEWHFRKMGRRGILDVWLQLGTDLLLAAMALCAGSQNTVSLSVKVSVIHGCPVFEGSMRCNSEE